MLPKLKTPKYYLMLFSYLLMSIAATILILASVFYIRFEHIMTDRALEFVRYNLDELNESFDRIDASVNKIGRQINSDASLRSFFLGLPLDSYTLMKNLEQLESYRFLSSEIDSIYLYNEASQTYYLSADHLSNSVVHAADFADNQIISSISSDVYTFTGPIPRKIPSLNPSNSSSYYYGYTYLINQHIDYTSRNGVIVINVSEHNVSSALEDLDSRFQGNTFMIDSTGRLIASTSKLEMLTDLSKESYVAEILNRPKTEYGVIWQDVDGVYSCVSFTAEDSRGWRYVNITSHKDIMREASALRLQITVIGLFILAFGVVLAVLLSHRLYGPVRILEQNLRTLQHESRNSHLKLKNNFLRNLLNHTHVIPSDVLSRDLERFDLASLKDSGVVIALLKIDGYQETLIRLGSDLPIYKFAVCNIVTELIPAKYRTQAVDMGEDCIAAYLCTSTGYDPYTFRQELTESMEKAQRACMEHLGFSFSAFFSTAAETPEPAPFLYHQVKQASIYRLFQGQRCILFCGSTDAESDAGRNYPFAKQKLFNEALLGGNIEQAKHYYLDIVETLRQMPPENFQQSFSLMTYHLSMTLDTIQKVNFPYMSIPFTFTLTLSDYESIEEVNQYIFGILDNVANWKKNSRTQKYNKLISRISDLIEQTYSDPNLSLNQIADTLDLSPNYISRLFKQYTSASIPESIMQCRLKKAKQLLLDTNDSIAQISEQIGFTSDGYFYKAFKKAYGMTPLEFRRGGRAQQESPLS